MARHTRNDEQSVRTAHLQEAATMGVEGPHWIQNGRVEVIRNRAAASTGCKCGVCRTCKACRTNGSYLVVVNGVAHERGERQRVAGDQGGIASGVSILASNAVTHDTTASHVGGPSHFDGRR